MILTPTQKSVAREKIRFKVINCGRGWGKTTYAIEELIGAAFAKPGARVVFIATTIQQARDIAWHALLERVRPIIIKKNASLHEVTIKSKSGEPSIIILRGWEAVETLRGQEFDFLVLDEVAQMRHFWRGWNDVLRPTLRMSMGEAIFISTPLGFNHFYDLYNTKDIDFKAYHFTSYDNPYLPLQEIEAAKRSLPIDSFAQEWLADFRKQTGLVYKEFDRKIHVKVKPKEVTGVKLGAIDFGYTNPTAVLDVIRDGDDNYWVVNEWYKTQRTEDQVMEYVKSQMFAKVYPDPANPSAIETLHKNGVNVIEVMKGPNSVVGGIDKVRAALKGNKLFIDPSCLNLISEFETYHYPDSSKERNEQELPEKDGDHAMDALRYLIMTDQKFKKPHSNYVYEPIEPLFSDIGL